MKIGELRRLIDPMPDEALFRIVLMVNGFPEDNRNLDVLGVEAKTPNDPACAEFALYVEATATDDSNGATA